MIRMNASTPPVRRIVATALAVDRSAHDRQRELVRASLLACPAASRATHRRWA